MLLQSMKQLHRVNNWSLAPERPIFGSAFLGDMGVTAYKS
jgi:hypothetical protein